MYIPAPPLPPLLHICKEQKRNYLSTIRPEIGWVSYHFKSLVCASHLPTSVCVDSVCESPCLNYGHRELGDFTALTLGQ
jgi:hypothetical protein